MNKIIILLSALMCALIQASERTTWLEIKPSYFFFFTSPLKHIYNNGGFEIQGSASIPLCNRFDLYGSIGYRKVSGHALNTCEKTSLRVLPIDLGLKPIFKVCERVYTFFAIGPRYFHLHQHNQSPYVDCKVNGSGLGLFLNAGFNLQLTHCFLLGAFGEYSYEKKKICPHMPNVFSGGNIQLGGFAFGISFGYAF